VNLSSPIAGAVGRDGVDLDGVLEGLGAIAYPLIALLVMGDGVVPILPGESTIAAGAALAGAGDLRISAVVACAIAGAVAGDSATYAIGRLGGPRLRGLAVRMAGERRIARGEEVFRRNATVAILVGRWIPGLRFTVALVAGALRIPYRRYLPLVVIGGTGWVLQNALIGFYLGRALAGNVPLAVALSIAAALAISSAVGLSERRRRRRPS
jgi:membrane-associated protein